MLAFGASGGGSNPPGAIYHHKMKNKKEKINELNGANMDIDLLPNPNITWHQDKCPWNITEKTNQHKCAVKNVSICKYFRGIKKSDIVLCAYPEKKSKKLIL